MTFTRNTAITLPAQRMDDDLEAWVGALIGGTAVRTHRQGRWRPQWFVDVERPDGTIVPVVVRFPREGARTATPDLTIEDEVSSPDGHVGIGQSGVYSVEREARVLAALQGSGVDVPRYYGFNPEHRAMVQHRVEGVAEFTDLIDPDTRRELSRQYFENLARLHNLDTEQLAHLFRTPVTDQDIALQGRYIPAELSYRRPEVTPDPLLDYASWWVHHHLRPQSRRLSLIHSDTGPGQFMFQNDKFTGLIDWEYAHLSTPMQDLGQIRMRDGIRNNPMGDLDEHFRQYQERYRGELDPDAIKYFTVVAACRTPMHSAAVLQRPDASDPMMAPLFGVDARIRVLLVEAIAEAEDIELSAPELARFTKTSRAGLHDFLIHFLEETAARDSDPYRRFQISCAAAAAEALRLAEGIGGDFDAQDLQDIRQVVDGRPADLSEGREALLALIADDPAGNTGKLLPLFYAIEVRRQALRSPLMAGQQLAKPLRPLNL